MKRKLLQLVLATLIVSTLSIVASAQGRGHGKGVGLSRQSDIFGNRGRGRNQDWKCGKFINCHDARDGRVDGRGPNSNRGVFQNGIFLPRGSRVRNRMIIRNYDQSRRNRLEMLRQERIAERRRWGYSRQQP